MFFLFLRFFIPTIQRALNCISFYEEEIDRMKQLEREKKKEPQKRISTPAKLLSPCAKQAKHGAPNLHGNLHVRCRKLI
jgi:hypothetical protein